MQGIRLINTIAAVVLLPFLLLVGSFYYKTEMELTPVVTKAFPDGEVELIIYQVGEPAWPFGPTDCRFDLRVDGDRVVKYPFSIHNDGAPAFESNFSVTWQEDHVLVLVSAEEQYDVNYFLFFDGTVEMQKME